MMIRRQLLEPSNVVHLHVMNGWCGTPHGSYVARRHDPRSYTSACENWFSPRAA